MKQVAGRTDRAWLVSVSGGKRKKGNGERDMCKRERERRGERQEGRVREIERVRKEGKVGEREAE